MANHILDGRELATRPDRMDFRDRSYQPPLVSLPESFPATDEIQAFLKRYYSDGRILNQGREGACTGFGLAAVVNYIIWDRWIRSHNGNPPEGEVQPQLVSPRMVYDTARIYDEIKRVLITRHGEARDHQIIENAAIFIEELRVTLLPRLQRLNVGWHQFFERFGRRRKALVIRHDEDLTHMGHVK